MGPQQPVDHDELAPNPKPSPKPNPKPKPNPNPNQVVLVDHGTPNARVNAVRGRLCRLG